MGNGNTVAFKGFACGVVLGEYSRGGIAISLVDAEDGSPVARATSWIPGLAGGEVAVKDSAENEGILDTLVFAGIVAPPHRRQVTPEGVDFPVCRILGS